MCMWYASYGLLTGEGAVDYIVEHAEIVVAFVQETKINRVKCSLNEGDQMSLISCQNGPQIG